LESSPPTPPGWYANPAGSGQRYWDGAQWTERYQPGSPAAAAPPKRSGIVWKVGLGVVLGGCLLIGGIGGCVALLYRRALPTRPIHAISDTQFRAIHPSTTQAAAEAALRVSPADKTSFSATITEPAGSTCIYYNKAKANLAYHGYQLCFDPRAGKLDAKKSF
jgi:hypothetical protein